MVVIDRFTSAEVVQYGYSKAPNYCCLLWGSANFDHSNHFFNPLSNSFFLFWVLFLLHISMDAGVVFGWQNYVRSGTWYWLMEFLISKRVYTCMCGVGSVTLWFLRIVYWAFLKVSEHVFIEFLVVQWPRISPSFIYRANLLNDFSLARPAST